MPTEAASRRTAAAGAAPERAMASADAPAASPVAIHKPISSRGGEPGLTGRPGPCGPAATGHDPLRRSRRPAAHRHCFPPTEFPTEGNTAKM